MRPAVPLEIAREILIEAGHRCSVCGTPSPLEKAHIVPWRKCREHTKENLICLCSNCHDRADHEGWGEATLREYKERPWVLRANNSSSPSGATTKVQVAIDIELKDFDGRLEDMLRYSLASFLRIDPESVKVLSKKPGSTIVTLELPVASADELAAKYALGDPRLLNYLSSLPPTAVKSIEYWRRRRGALVRAMDTAIMEIIATAEGKEKEEVELDLIRVIDALPARCRRVLRRRYMPSLDQETGSDMPVEQPTEESGVVWSCMSELVRHLLVKGFSGEVADSESEDEG